MSTLSAIDTAWANVTLTGNEFWQCRAGQVLVTAEASPSGTEGVLLTKGIGLEYANGDTVSYRRIDAAPAEIWREPRA